MTTLTDVFAPDGFNVYSLSQAIQKIPPVPSGIADEGIFREVPVTGTLVAVEESQGKLTLVPTTKRGGPGIPSQDQKRKVVPLKVPHIQMDDTVHADDVLNVRAFGSTDAMAGVSEVVGRKLETMRRSIDSTIEYLRMGALAGTVTYPTNSVDANLDLLTAFGTTQQTATFLLGTSTTRVIETIIPGVRDQIETALGGTPYAGITALCGRNFFRSLIGHATVIDAYKAQMNQWNLTPVVMRSKRMRITLNGVTFVEYYGIAGGVTFLHTDKAYIFPTGADIFLDHCAPADLVEAVGTLGQPMYARQYAAPDGKSVNLEVQANRLPICSRPRAVVYATYNT